MEKPVYKFKYVASKSIELQAPITIINNKGHEIKNTDFVADVVYETNDYNRLVKLLKTKEFELVSQPEVAQKPESKPKSVESTEVKKSSAKVPDIVEQDVKAGE